jgi:hypothetical protein
MKPFSFDARVVVAILAFTATAGAAPHLKVRGALRLDCHAGHRHGRLVVEGRTLDDAGRPVGGHPLRIAATSPTGAVTLVHAVACAGSREQLEEKEGGLALESDEAGRFCLEATLPSGAYDVFVDGIGTELLSPARAKLSVDLSKRAVRLRFDPEPHVITLDTFSGSIDAIADEERESEGDAQPVPVVNLPLELRSELGLVIARATTQSDGRATFTMSADSLGAPGRGELIVAFAGDADVMPSEHAEPVERRAWVTISAPSSASGTPEDGIAFDVGARTRFGDVPDGAIEALLGGVTVGAASVSLGHASMVAVFASPPSPPRLTLRYVPAQPYYVPAGTTTLAVEVRAPSPLRQLPLVLGALGAFAWLLLGRTARKRKTMAPPPEGKPSFEGAPRMVVTQSAPSQTRRWNGRVLDAHDGTPIAGVRVAIERPSFGDAKETLASTFTAVDGTFQLGDIPLGSGLMLGAEGPLHHALTRPLPPPGTLEIALVSRKRRLLDRLVEWARRRGPPYDDKPEPTPLHVRRAARDQRTAAWAEAVEQAAFDQVDVDARTEQEIEKLEPKV